MHLRKGFPVAWWTIYRILIAAAVLLTAWGTHPSTVSAWARTGHRVVALIAESQLTPTALAAVRSLLEPGETLANDASWADFETHCSPLPCRQA